MIRTGYKNPSEFENHILDVLKRDTFISVYDDIIARYINKVFAR